MTITPSIKRDFLLKLSNEGKRVDGRKFDDFRNIKIELNVANKAEGSAKVTIGNTQVLVGIKMDVGEPYLDNPGSGVMSTAAELIPMASPDFESGPPDEESIELARVVDRGIRESELIDLDKLCIEHGKLVWVIFIDIHILNYDGNLFDAASLAAIAALKNTKVPVKDQKNIWLLKTLFQQENDQISNNQRIIREFMKNNVNLLLENIQKKEPIWNYLEKDHKEILKIINDYSPVAFDYWYNNKENFELPIKEKEISISCTSVKYNNTVVTDPVLDEEQIAEARLTVATDNNGDVRAMQKGLNGSFSVDEIKKVIKSSIDNGRKIREQLYKSVGK